uniref:PAS domain-containing protein n=1 Tax=Ruegeria sp. PR1b TaxID=185588 RepID=UPI00146D37C0|nr:PAS domain-containing protein [Ruegeria sp. PR1b]
MTTDTDDAVLRAIFQAQNDACWCMEFERPIDLTVPDHEIVRQVFENDPYWRLTNPAMARFYRLDPSERFEDRHPSEIFPRSPQNEDYVLTLIASGFEVDAAPAIDRRYDGTEIYVENDVRAHIRDGKLLRMFGVVRNVDKHRHREAQIRNVLDNQVDILSALPMGVLATGADGQIDMINRAAERLLNVSLEQAIGQRVEAIVPGAPALLAAIEDVLAQGHTRAVMVEGLSWSIAPRLDAGVVAVLQHANQAEVAE